MNIKKSNLKEKLKLNPSSNTSNKKPPADTSKTARFQSDRKSVKKEEDTLKVRPKTERDSNKDKDKDKETYKARQNETLNSKKDEIIYYDPTYTPRDNLYQGKITPSSNEPINYLKFKRSISPGIGANIIGVGPKKNADMQAEINPADPRNMATNTLKVGKKPPVDSIPVNFNQKLQKNEEPYSSNSHFVPKNSIFSPGNNKHNYNMIYQQGKLDNNARSPDSNAYVSEKISDKGSFAEKDQKTLRSRTDCDDNRTSYINDLYRNSILNNVHAQHILNYKKSQGGNNIFDSSKFGDTNLITGMRSLKRRISFAFDKNAKEGRLLTTAVTYVESKPNTGFTTSVKSNKGAKLSTLMLSKSADPPKRNMNTLPEDNFRTPNMSPKVAETKKTNFNFFKMDHNPRFIKLTLAMLTGKGVHGEDRMITRDMRLEKGGVVDFSQNQKKAGKQYQIKNIIASKSPSGKNKKNIKVYSYKEREKNAKLIQKWWREFLESYNEIKRKINRIQSYFRGYVVRKSLSDLLYVSIFGKNFSDKLIRPIVTCVRRHVFGILAHTYTGDETKIRIITEKIVRIQRNFRNYMDQKKARILRKPYMKLRACFRKSVLRNKNDCKRYYFNLWKNRNFEMRKAEIMSRGKKKTRELLLKKMILNPKGFQLLSMRKYWRIWKKHLDKIILHKHFLKWFMPEANVKDVFVHNYNMHNRNRIVSAIDKLLNHLRRRNMKKYVIKAFKVKQKKENLKKALQKADLIRTKMKKKGIRKYFVKWRRCCVMRKTLILKQEKSNNLVSKLYGKIIDLLTKILKKRLIVKRFYSWRNKAFRGNDSIRVRKFTEGTGNYIQKNFLFFLKKRFYEKLINFRSRRYKNKRLKDAFLTRMNKNILFLKKYFINWKNKVFQPKNKQALLRNNIVRSHIIAKIKKLSTYFIRWKDLVLFKKQKIFIKRKNKTNDPSGDEDPENEDFIRRAMRNAFIDEDGKSVIKFVRKNPKTQKLSEFFTRWWKNSKKEEQKVLKSMCKKMNMNNLKKIILSKNPLKKFFRLWLKHLIPTELRSNKYKLLKQGMEILKLGVIHMNLRKNEDIIDKLKEAVSPQYLEKVLFNKLLPRCSKLNEKHKNNRLSMAFKKWRKVKEVDDVKKLQFKVLHKMKNHKISDLLRKKFLFWKNNKPIESKVYPNSAKASNLLRETLKKNQYPEIMKRLKRLSHMKKRDKLLSKVVSKKESDQRNNLREYFIRWWRKIVREDKVVLKSTCKNLKLRNMKKFILLNKPLQKFFKRWLKGLIEIKKDNFLQTKEGLSKIKSAATKNAGRHAFPLLKSHISSGYVTNSFVKKIFPKCKNLQERQFSSRLRYFFNRWKKKNETAKIRKMKLKILSNLKANDENDNLRRYFNKWRLGILQWKTNLIDKVVPRVIQGNDKLNKTLKKNLAPEMLKKMKAHRDAKNKIESVENQIRHKLKSQKFLLKSYFMKWWKNKVGQDENKFKDVFKKMKDVYLKNLRKSIERLNQFSLEKYFRKWLRKIIMFNQDKKGMDCFKLVNKVRKIYTGKHGKGFIESLKNYNSPAYVKKTIVRKLLPTCKILNERTDKGNKKYYFGLWKKANDIENLKATKFKLVYKLKGKNLRDELRKYFILWRKTNNAIKKRIRNNIPILLEVTKKSTLKEPFQKVKDVFIESKINDFRENIMHKTLRNRTRLLHHSLRRCFLKWKDLMKDFLVNDFKNKLFKGPLKKFEKMRDNHKLRKAFQSWRSDDPYVGEDDNDKEQKLEKIRKKKKKLNKVPYVIGLQIIRKTMQKRALEMLKKKTELLNLKVPSNVSLKQALLSSTKGVHKNLSVKLLFLRFFLNKWKKFNNHQATEDLKTNVVGKMFSKCKFMKLIPLKRALKLWKDKVDEMNRKKLENDFKANIHKMIYGKHFKALLRKKFLFWNENIANYNKKLENVVKGVSKIHKNNVRKTLRDLKKRLDNKKFIDIKQRNANKVMKRLIRSTHQGNLLIYFNNWRRSVRTLRERQFKNFILKSMVNKIENNKSLKQRVQMKEVFLRWKINATPKDILERISNNRKGIELLKKTIIRIYENDPFKRIKQKWDARGVMQNFRQQLSKQNIKLRLVTIRRKFNHLHDMVVDRKNMKRKFHKLFNRFLVKRNDEIFSQPTKMLIEGINDYTGEKNKKAAKIQRNFRAGRVKKRSDKLGQTIENIHLRNLLVERIYLHRWVNISKLIWADTNARTVQTFLKSKFDKVKKERSETNIANLLRRRVKQQTERTLRNVYRVGRLVNALRKAIYKGFFDYLKRAQRLARNSANKEKYLPKFFKKRRNIYLGRYFNKFKRNTIENTLHKVKKLQNVFKCQYIRKKETRIVKKKDLSKKMFNLKCNNLSFALLLYFLKWKRKFRTIKLNEKAKIIQDVFRRRHIYKVMEGAVKNLRLEKLLKDFYKHKTIEALRSIFGNKQQTQKNIEDIVKQPGFLERKALNNLLDLSKNKIRNGIIESSCRRNFKLNRRFLVEKYFRRWKDITNKLNNAATLVQNKYRKFLAKKRLDDLLFTRNLLARLVSKYESKDYFTKSLFFTLYKNIVRAHVMKENVKKIENFLQKGVIEKKIKEFRYFVHDVFARSVVKSIKYTPKIIRLRDSIRSIPKLKVFKKVQKKRNVVIAKKALKKNILNKEGLLKRVFLRFYLKKWFKKSKRFRKSESRAADKIRHCVRGFLERLRLVRNVLKCAKPKKLLYCLNVDHSRLMRIYFVRWRNICSKRIFEESAKVIEKFMRGVQRSCQQKKKKTLFFNNYKGLRHLRVAWELHKKREVIKNLKDFPRNLAFSKFLKELSKKKRKITEDAIQKISQTTNYKKDKFKDSIVKVQRNFKKFRIRKHIWGLIHQIRTLRNILMLVVDKNRRVLMKYYRFWKFNSLQYLLHHNAKIIQEFIRNGILNKTRQDKMEKSNNLQSLFSRHYFYVTIIGGLKNAATLLKYSKSFRHLKKYALMKFQKNIDLFEKRRNLHKLFRLPPHMRNRLLKRHYDIWKDKSQALAEKKASTTLQRNFRIYKENKKKVEQTSTLQRIVKVSCLRYIDKTGYYFSHWRRTSYLINLQIASDVICDFFRIRLDTLKAARNWLRLGRLLKFRDFRLGKDKVKYQAYDHNKLIKLCKPLERVLKREAFHKIREKEIRVKVLRKLQGEVNRLEHTNNVFDLRKYFVRWLFNKRLLENKDNKLGRVVEILETVRMINSSLYIHHAFTVKKFLHLKQGVEKFHYFKKLKHNDDRIKNGRQLSKLLEKSHSDLVNFHSKNGFMVNLYKIYVYKILCQLKTNLGKIRSHHLRKHYNHLRNNINEKKLSHAAYRGKENMDSRHIPNVKRFNFQASTSKVSTLLKAVPKDSDLDVYYRYISPYLAYLIRRMVLEREREAFEKIRTVYKGQKLVSHLLKAIKPLRDVNKMRVFNKITMKCDHDSIRPHFMKHLRVEFRKYLIFSFSQQMIPIARMMNLFNLVKTTLMHKEIAQDKYNVECLSRWKVLAHMKRITKQKLHNLYKNMQSSYQSVAEELFGDHDKRTGMIKEFGNYGEKISMTSHAKLQEKYYAKINSKFSDAPQADPAVDNKRRQTILNRLKSITIEHPPEELKEEEPEILNTLESKNSDLSEMSFKSIESEPMARGSGKIPGHKYSSSNVNEPTNIKAPSTGTHRKSSMAKEEKKMDFSNTTGAKQSIKKKESIVKKK